MSITLSHTVFSNISIYTYCCLGKISVLKNPNIILSLFYRIFNPTPRRKPSLTPPTPQHPKQFHSYHFSCWEIGEFWDLKPWAEFPTCHKAMYSPNTALKCLADQWTSTVGDYSADENFYFSQHSNRINERLLSVRCKRRSGNYRNTSSMQCFTFLI